MQCTDSEPRTQLAEVTSLDPVSARTKTAQYYAHFAGISAHTFEGKKSHRQAPSTALKLNHLPRVVRASTSDFFATGRVYA
jgi:hypothetical protein